MKIIYMAVIATVAVGLMPTRASAADSDRKTPPRLRDQLPADAPTSEYSELSPSELASAIKNAKPLYIADADGRIHETPAGAAARARNRSAGPEEEVQIEFGRRPSGGYAAYEVAFKGAPADDPSQGAILNVDGATIGLKLEPSRPLKNPRF